MAEPNGDRARHWPAIERKHGQPIEHWFALVRDLGDARYPEQMALLQEGHGFSRAHANAVVMHCRGSTSQRRFTTLDAYLADADPVGAATVRAILAAAGRLRPDLELVIAWNQPMLRGDDGYVFGASLGKRHILIAPWARGRLEALRPRLEAEGYAVNRKTVRVPLDWAVDEALLGELIGA